LIGPYIVHRIKFMAVQSPCIDDCKFDRKSDMCVGCFRTNEEIRQWKKMTDHKRHQILALRRQRQSKIEKKAVSGLADRVSRSE